MAQLGPFFGVERHAADAVVVQPWRRMDELIDGSGALAARIATVRSGLAMAGGVDVDAVEERVAASVAQLGLCARLIAPVLGAEVLGSALRPALDDLWWQDELGGAFPLSVSDGDAAGSLYEWIAAGPIAALVDAVAATVPVSLQVLWGNIASAVNSAAVLIASARPDLAVGAHDLATRLLADAVLNPSGATAGPSFVRSSCCLIYRIASETPSPTAVCGDCVLR